IRAMEQFQRKAGSDEPFGAVLRTTSTEFFRPVMYPDDVVIRIWVSRIGNTSFEMQHELSQNGKVAVTVEAVVVMFCNEVQPVRISHNVCNVLEVVLVSRTETRRNSSNAAVF